MIRDYEGAKNSDVYNKVFALGRVINYGHTQNGIRTFELLVRGVPAADGRRTRNRRASEGEAANGRERENDLARNTILNIAYGSGADEHSGGIPLRSMVAIEGHINANSYKNEIFDRWGYIQYIEADRITFVPSEMEEVFGVKGFHYENTYVRTYLKGTVAKIIPPRNGSNWVNLSVRTSGRAHGGRGVVRAQYSVRMRRVNEIGMTLKEGDKICLVGTISSTDKPVRGVLTHFEDVIIDDMQILERAENNSAPGEEKPQRITEEASVPAGTAAPETDATAETAPGDETAPADERTDEERLRASINNTVESLLGL